MLKCTCEEGEGGGAALFDEAEDEREESALGQKASFQKAW